MAANPLLQILLGANHEQVQAKLREKSRQRKANRAQRRAQRGAKRPRRAAGQSWTWTGQAAPPPQQNGLRPPPPPGGPSAYAHPWQGPMNGAGAWSTAPVPHSGQPASSAAGRVAAPSPADTTSTQRLAAPVGDQPGGTGVSGPPEQQPEDGRPSAADEPWVPVSELPPEPWWVRIRRGLVVVVALVVVAAGVVSITGTVVRWVEPPAPPPAAPAITDVQLSGFAETAATDYLSWDSTDKPTRQTALSRYAAPGRQIDGWDGNGRQSAESASTVDIRRGPGADAIATVRVRVTPYTGGGAQPPAAAPPQTPDAGSTVAAAPKVAQAGTAQPARWITLAVPVSSTGGRLVVPASPALVGSPPDAVGAPAVPGETAGDDEFAKATKPTVGRLLGAYASGDLSYARASETHFAGLSGAAKLAELDQWRVRPLTPGADPTRRVGDATVTWELSGGAGKITCSYLVQLQQNDGRWYLAGLTAETQEVSQ